LLNNKIPPPIVGVLFAILIWGLAGAGSLAERSSILHAVFALILLCIAMLMLIAGAVSFRKASTTVNPLKPDSATALVTSGVYQYSRNPMYLGLALIMLSWCVFLASWWSLLGVAGFVVYINRFQIEPEERAMQRLFGESYAEYRQRVRRWL